MSWKAVSIGAAVLVLGFALQRATAEGISGAEARELVKKGATLLDVRTTDEFRDGHIEGAVNIPVQDLAGRMGELGDKSRPVVVYCFSGGRSRRAASMMREAGFKQVSDLGPMGRWTDGKK